MPVTLNAKFQPVCCEGFILMKDHPNSVCVICDKEYNTRELVDFIRERKYPLEGAKHE